MSGSRESRRRKLWETVGGRVVDTALIVVAAAIGLIAVARRVASPEVVPVWISYGDWILGALGCVALWWRRRFPVALATVLIVSSSVSETASGPAIVALFTVAVHCSTRATAALCMASLAALSVYELLRPEPVAPPALMFATIVLGHVAVVTWGLSVRSRRELLASLRERAEAADVEAQLRAERSQREAREVLAREMHDVLGHRLSLVSVHAGALAYHRNASTEDITRAAEKRRSKSWSRLKTVFRLGSRFV